MDEGRPPQKRPRLVSYSDSDSDENMEVNQTVNDEKLYKISQISRKIATRYNMEELGYEVIFDNEKLNNKNLEDITDTVKEMFQDLLDASGRNYDGDDRVRLSIMHDSLDTPIIVHLAPRHQVDADTVMDRQVYYFKNA